MNPLNFLESGEYEIEFKWINKNDRGGIDNEKKIITINLLLLLTETFIHEFLHYQDNTPDEEKILLKQKKLLNRMSKNDIQAIGKKLTDLLFTQK